MSLLYSFSISEDGSYKFTTDLGLDYLIYFSATSMVDEEGNNHTLFNIGFSRNGDHFCVPFVDKYDCKIRNTIMFIVNDVFVKNEHRVLIYFCFGDDGYSRHRKITFNTSGRDLSSGIEKYDNDIDYEGTKIYGSLVLTTDNPLKRLILNAFSTYLNELKIKPDN